MSVFGDFGRAYAEGLGVQAFGPDWRQKRALLEAQLPQENAQTAAIQSATAGKGIANEQAQFDLDQAKAQLEEMRKLHAAGVLPSSDLKAAEFLMAQKMHEAQLGLIGAQTEQANAHAEYYKNPPSHATNAKPRLVQTPSGYVWAYPPEAGGKNVETGLSQPPTSDQRNRTAAMDRAGAIVDEIDDLSKKINTGSGPAARVTGAARTAGAALNLDPDVSTYNALISGFTPMIARAVGHSGVLTEQDVQSVRELFPKPGDSETVRNRKMAQVRAVLGGMSTFRLPSQGKSGVGMPGPAIDGAPTSFEDVEFGQ